MKILIACEFSGVVREAFRKKGHDAWSCDLLPSEDNSEFHIQGDVRDLKLSDYDLVGSHIPCTYMCNSGVSWLHKDESRWDELQKSNEFFHFFWQSNVKYLYIENPIPHKYALLPPYTQKIQPYDFGHGESKATCLWLKGLPKLEKTSNIYDWDKLEHKIESGRNQRLHLLPPSETRWMERSRTYPGIAEAMADQWGSQSFREVMRD